MATLAEVVRKQRKSGGGVIGSLASAIGQKTLEKIDPRRMLNQRGLLTSLFPSLKAYEAKGSSGAERIAKPAGDSGATFPIFLEMITKLDTIGDSTRLTAKNSMTLPGMSRDMNIMRQNIVKLVKLQGGKAATKADNFFLRAFEREKATEAEMQTAKERRSTGAATKSTEVKESSSGSMLGGMLGLLSVGSLVSVAGKIISAITSIPSLIMSGLGTLTSLLSSGVKLVFDVAKGAASLAGPGIKAVGMSLFTIIKSIAAFLISGPGLAVLGVGAVAGLLAYLLTNEKTKSGPGVDTGMSPEDVMAAGGGAPPVPGVESPIPPPQPTPPQPESSAGRTASRKRKRISSKSQTSTSESSTSPTPATPEPKQESTSPRLVPSVPPDELGGINYTSYAQEVGKRESGGNYKAVNSLGYLGKYQFGAMALEDLGLVKTGVGKKGLKALDDNSNWNIEGGKEAFLNNPSLQEQTMVRYTKMNFGRLKRLGVINNETPSEKVAGFLASAHLVGPGGAAAMSRGEIRKDAYGTSAQSYFKLGSASQGDIQPAPSTSGAQVAAASSEVIDSSRAAQTQQPVVVNAPTTNVNQSRGGGSIMGSMADTMDRELSSLLVDRMVGA